MRGMMPLFALALAAGCVQGENEIGPERPAPTPSSTLVPVSCPRIDLDVPDTLRQWGSAEMWANITNCSDVPAQLLSDEKCIFDRGVQVWLTRAGLSQSWLLFDGPAYETLGEGPWERMSCGDSPRAETTLAPGETWPHRFSWDASYQAGPCEPGCD
ncbi:MAG TPA: hypothetical protein VM370_07515, partial [Candidatus Thermoplasmatota archaeon]|nr:hypothetical protein [Candidatus Thermoplasmatota archaeon]